MQSVTVAQKSIDRSGAGLKPLRPLKATLIFFALGLLTRFSVYNLGPWLIDRDLNPFEMFIATFTVPVAIMFALAFAIAKREGAGGSLRAYAARFRLKRIDRRTLGWTVLGILLLLVLTTLMAPTIQWVLDRWPALNPPEGFPAINNPRSQSGDLPALLTDWMGPAIVGDTGMVLAVLVLYFFNTFGEELFWRGIIFPRQELVHGRRTWLVHGLMWNLFHLPIYPWYLIFGLAITLVHGLVIQKTGNTWSTIILHGLSNLLVYTMMIMAILELF